ncbi:hypothetical protein HKX48_005071 [Thoreauomyces humboldtii]|nr:hypothetical protein HKX48_005071 [Thoreauomyces humboldtii]
MRLPIPLLPSLTSAIFFYGTWPPATAQTVDIDQWISAHRWTPSSQSSVVSAAPSPPFLPVAAFPGAVELPPTSLSSFPASASQAPLAFPEPSNLPLVGSVSAADISPVGGDATPTPAAFDLNSSIDDPNSLTNQAFDNALDAYTSNATAVKQEVASMPPERKANALLLAAAVIDTSVFPTGTKSAVRFGVVIFLVASFMSVMLFFELRRWMIGRRNAKYSKRLDRSVDAKEAKAAAEALEKGSSTGTLLDDDSLQYDVAKSAPPPSMAEGQQSFDIEFENLGLMLATGTEIMRGVTGSLKAGKLTAVMGPSGAGKTTFVSLLTGKAKRTDGIVRINGVEEELSHYRKLIGFVPQEDIMLRELTVRDILMHSALMRLPTNWSNKRKKDLVLDTLAFLGLENIMNSIVGDEVTRGISGGQRKRVNIGMELVAAPVCLMLDEPTSGLDSATSFEVCKLLHTIAREQRMTIAAVVHSPSPTAFEQFDDLLLLGKGGRTVYMGPRDRAAKYFESIGFENYHGVSESDFFMDVATGRIPCSKSKNFKPPMLFTCWERFVAGEDPASGLVDKDTMLRRKKTVLAKMARKSKFLETVASSLASSQEYWNDVGDEALTTFRQLLRRDPVRSTPNSLQVFYLCYVRACTQIIHLLCGIFISVACYSNDYAGLYPHNVCAIAPPVLGRGLGCSKAIDKLSPSGMFISLGVLFAGVTVGGSTFGLERVVYWRDTAAGMPTLPYFFAKWTADLPRMILASIMFTSSLVLLCPYHSELWDIAVLVATLYFAAFSMGYFLSAMLRPPSVPLATTGFVLLWAMLLGGATPDFLDVQTKSMYDAFRWLWSISAPRWTIEAWYIKEAVARPWAELHDLPLGHAYDRNNYGTALTNVVLIGIGWAVLAIVGLKLVNREKQK